MTNVFGWGDIFATVIIFAGIGCTIGIVCGVTIYEDRHINPLGQMICDEQYGEGNTRFSFLGSESIDGKYVVACDKLPETREFDGGRTKLIGGD